MNVKKWNILFEILESTNRQNIEACLLRWAKVLKQRKQNSWDFKSKEVCIFLWNSELGNVPVWWTPLHQRVPDGLVAWLFLALLAGGLRSCSFSNWWNRGRELMKEAHKVSQLRINKGHFFHSVCCFYI